MKQSKNTLNKELLRQVDEEVTKHGFSKNNHPIVKTLIATGLAFSFITLATRLRENYVNNFRSYKLGKRS